jgi:hypothetical protein
MSFGPTRSLGLTKVAHQPSYKKPWEKCELFGNPPSGELEKKVSIEESKFEEEKELPKLKKKKTLKKTKIKEVIPPKKDA